MSKALSKSLKMDLPALAELLRSKGRGNDTMLAHITPKEAALLKRRGGSGSINPDTGLPEFDDFVGETTVEAAPQSPVYDVVSGGGGGGDNLGKYTYTPTVDPNLPNPQIAYGAGAGKNIVLPGEGGDISAYQPYVANTQPYLQTSADAAKYGFPNIPTSQLPATNVETPTPAELTQLQAGGPQDVTAQAPGAPKTDQQSALEKLGLTGKDLTRMGLGALLTGGLAATNVARTRQAQQQAQQAQSEQQALAAPYQQQGKALVTQAQAGQLSPQSQAAYQAAQARINQGIASRGGVGVQQASNELATIYQSLLANQYQLGQQVLNIGDNYALGAIKTGLQANQAVNQANQQFYTALAQMAAPFLMGQQPVYQLPTTTGVNK